MTFFLDTEENLLIADSRAELVDALLEHLAPETVDLADLAPETVDLADLAAACLGVTALDVMIVES